MPSRPARVAVPVAIHPFLTRGNDILLIRRYNTGYEDGKYSVIAGHIDGGEAVTTAMCREAFEEGGIELDPDALPPAGVMHRQAPDGERIDFFFTVDRWKGDLRNLEPEKCDEFRWVSPVTCPKTPFPPATKTAFRIVATLVSGLGGGEGSGGHMPAISPANQRNANLPDGPHKELSSHERYGRLRSDAILERIAQW